MCMCANQRYTSVWNLRLLWGLWVWLVVLWDQILSACTLTIKRLDFLGFQLGPRRSINGSFLWPTAWCLGRGSVWTPSSTGVVPLSSQKSAIPAMVGDYIAAFEAISRKSCPSSTWQTATAPSRPALQRVALQLRDCEGALGRGYASSPFLLQQTQVVTQLEGASRPTPQFCDPSKSFSIAFPMRR